MKFNSIRFKTSVLFAGILCLILSFYSAVLFFTVYRILYWNFDRDIQIKVEQISGILNAYAEVKTMEAHPLTFMKNLLAEKELGIDSRSIVDKLWKVDVQSLGLKNDMFQIFNRSGEEILSSGSMPKSVGISASKAMPLSFQQVYFGNMSGEYGNFRVINFPFLYNKQAPLVIRLATSRQVVIDILNELLMIIGIAVVMIIAAASFFGIFLTRSILKPVVSVTQTANRISHKNLTARVADQEIDVEMRGLIESFNTMIGRLEISFSHINEFSSHVAHELKTPLAIMKGEMELALSEDSSVEEYKRVLVTSLEEIERMIKITKDLLLLAKLDYKPDVFNFITGDLVPFLKDIYEHSSVLALEKKISLEIKVPGHAVFVQYDAVHLRRLVFNLIHNAIKFTPLKGRIVVELTVKDDHAVLSVADSGIGISPGDTHKIFEKFYRVEDMDETRESGTGLGLAIAQSIARAHSGQISVQSQKGQGATFTVSFSLSS